VIGEQVASMPRVQASGATPAAWRLVFLRELTDLWLGGKAPVLLLLYGLMLGVETFVMASNSELSLLPPKEMVYETLKSAIAVGIFIGLIIGADTISGDRERGTLEAMLLTPTSRAQIVAGKFLAAISPWPIALLITVPYFYILAQGDAVFGEAVFWGALLGTVMALGYTALGVAISFWCSTNKTSYLVNLAVYVCFLVPSQLPGSAQEGQMGQFLQWTNPMAATNHFLSKVMVNNRTVAEFGTWLLWPSVFTAVFVGLLLFYLGPALRLEPGRPNRLITLLSRIAGVLLVVCLPLFLSASPAQAQGAPAKPAQAGDASLQVAIDLDQKTVNTGDHFNFKTTVTNTGQQATPPLIVAMNVINLVGDGNPVDPEDWSPQRTQPVRTLAPGQSIEMTWQIDAILEGDYMVYMVAIPSPSTREATTHPVSSAGIHLTVMPFTRLNPLGVLPFVVGGPIVLLLAVMYLIWLRRRRIDTGAGQPQESLDPA
jgi:ABC-2 type transport system permease protein